MAAAPPESIPTPRKISCEIANLLGLLLELLDGSLVDTTALVDQVTGGGRFSRIDVTNDDDVDVDFLLSHFELS